MSLFYASKYRREPGAYLYTDLTQHETYYDDRRDNVDTLPVVRICLPG